MNSKKECSEYLKLGVTRKINHFGLVISLLFASIAFPVAHYFRPDLFLLFAAITFLILAIYFYFKQKSKLKLQYFDTGTKALRSLEIITKIADILSWEVRNLKHYSNDKIRLELHTKPNSFIAFGEMITIIINDEYLCLNSINTVDKFTNQTISLKDSNENNIMLFKENFLKLIANYQ
ncbi:MAG: hypothetical protein EA412_14655 [Chitinophagaceae bacterium]|nr:MAG: hypothetical protein EA412_14655 [Chitinophagaceae bacterium]